MAKKISVMDRGFLYGDGVFESLRTYGGKPFLLGEHLKRLRQGLKVISIKIALEEEKIRRTIQKLMRKKRLKDAYIKIIITRGEARGHGLDPRKVKGKPTIIILVEKAPHYPVESWKAIISSICRPDIPISRIKSLNYLDNVLAKMEASRAGAQEAFFLDEDGHVVEGTVSNIFLVKKRIIYTPSLKEPVLAGVTRALVIKLARRAGFTVKETIISPQNVFTADECFITFSGAGIMPIVSVNKKKIGRGRPGAITAKLIKLYQQCTSRH